jgi:thymidylate kinase
MAPLIAVIGCDGSGKSTVSADLIAWIEARYGPTSGSYLGLRSGVIGNKIKSWPLIGPAFERALSKRAKQARTKGGTIPGIPTALVIYAFSIIRKWRFKRMLALREQGVIVVADRYPQIEVPGFYDGPGLSAARAEGWLVSKLAAREAALYRWMADHKPDLVIRLNVDLDTAFARKPDHKFDSLKQKIEVTPRLTFGGADLIDLDSTDPLPEVLDGAHAAVSAKLAELGRAPAGL